MIVNHKSETCSDDSYCKQVECYVRSPSNYEGCYATVEHATTVWVCLSCGAMKRNSLLDDFVSVKETLKRWVCS